jgi:hypothetical protein
MRPVGLLLGLALSAGTAAAQTMRDFTVERGRRSEQALRMIVDFTAGELFLRPSQNGALYRMQLRYDAERYDPRGAYQAERSVVRLGLERNSAGGLRVASRGRLAQQAVVEVTPDADLTLEANLGAAESSLELGGLRLEDLSIISGASRTELRFSRPNRVLCRRAQISSGAADLRVSDLGNSGCRRWTIEGGVGQVRLDLGGEWPEETEISVRMTVGGVRLVIPRDLGVRLRLSRFLASFSPDRFSRSGRAYTSESYASARRKVDLEIDTTLGSVAVEWR